MEKEKEVKIKFKGSAKFEAIERFYYDGARQMMKDHGYAAAGNFVKNELPNIPDDSLKISKERFKEILAIAQKDYLDILFDPFGFETTWLNS